MACILAGCVALVGSGGPRAHAAGPAFLSVIQTAEEFDTVSVPSQLGGEKERFTKYLVPASDDPSLLQPVFQNVSLYPFHYDFMRIVFPDRFPGLDMTQYLQLVEQRATRTYYAGLVSRFRTPTGTLYGFSVFTRDPQVAPGELLSAEETRAVYDRLSAVFHLQPLRYAPDTKAALEEALSWSNPGFPIYFGGVSQASYEAYTRSVGYGRVRRLTATAFDEANRRGSLTWQDVLVLERAPSDIEGVVAGVITGEPQGELSHIAIRTARRGTPNAFVEDAMRIFEPYEGKLVRLEVTATSYSVREAELPEAEQWWAEHRPHLSAEPVLDPTYGGLDSLLEMDLSGNPVPPESRFGGKASNLARLQRILTGPLEAYRETGFAIPVRYYLEFIRSNETASAIDPRRRVTYEQYLSELQSSERFLSDSEFRAAALERFRDVVEDDSVLDPQLVDRLAARIVEIFGSADVMVRFRSSSNVEDVLEFNGAGLYDSASACAADDLDGDLLGPCRCDTSKAAERRIGKALREVWASLWTFRANEERSYYGIPQDKVAMGILVTRTFLVETANGVAFTGNPANRLDRRYLITAQVGEESVVTPEPGKVPEKDLLDVQDGAIVSIDRVRPSSLVKPGELVLSDASLGELGSVLWKIDREFPVELGTHLREEVLFDVEFKVDLDGSLAVKQVRPFLTDDPPPPGPTFELEIPAGTVVCGVFTDGREPRGEYEAKSQIRLKAGRHVLPTGAPVFAGSLVEELVYGTAQAKADPAVPGRFGWTATAQGNGEVTYRFSYVEHFTLPGGESLKLELSEFSVAFTVRPGEEPVTKLVADDVFLTDELILTATPVGDPTRLASYESCSHSTIPLWRVRAEVDGGDLIELDERYRPADAGSGPASLAGAVVTIGGNRREVTDYWHLVYSAQHHNVQVRYWVILDPPVATDLGEVHAIELAEPDPVLDMPAAASYLGPDLEVLATRTVSCYQKGEPGNLQGCERFRRGDTDGNGAVSLTDAVATCLYLFQGGAEPGCLDASDFNDDGIVELTDAVLSLHFLFNGVDFVPAPGPYECAQDPTPDDLPRCVDASCR